MATLIPWPDTRARPVRRTAREGDVMGQILFFTGVRYERHTPDDNSHPRGQASSQTRRKRRRA